MFVEKRKFDRLELEDISAKLYRVEDNVEIDFCMVNVSQQGTNVLTSSHIPANTEVILALAEQDVRLSLRWCVPKDNDPAVYRCGFETVDPSINLTELIKKELDI